MSLRGQGIGIAFAALMALTGTASANERVIYASVGDTSRAPIGWVEFCADNPSDCRTATSQPRDIVMTQTAWKDLVRVNRWVN